MDRLNSRVAVQFIRDHPRMFAELIFFRIRGWWLGWGANGEGPGRWLRQSAMSLWFLFVVAGICIAWRRRLAIGIPLTKVDSPAGPVTRWSPTSTWPLPEIGEPASPLVPAPLASNNTS